MADASSIDNGLLISLVENKPVLWDKTMEGYKNRAASQAAWKQIMMALNPAYKVWHEITRQSYVKLIMQRWTYIRDNYYRTYRKIQKQKRAGSKRTIKPYIYNKKLKFLQKLMPPNKETSNATTENENLESEEDESETIDGSENSMDSYISNVMEAVSATPERQNRNRTGPKIPTRPVQTNTHSLDSNMAAMDSISNQEPSTSNRHLSFFKGILPSLHKFNDNETLDFQMGVLKLLKKIKRSRQSQQFPSFSVNPEDSSSSNSGYSS